jgi:hypothetical protein
MTDMIYGCIIIYLSPSHDCLSQLFIHNRLTIVCRVKIPDDHVLTPIIQQDSVPQRQPIGVSRVVACARLGVTDFQ